MVSSRSRSKFLRRHYVPLRLERLEDRLAPAQIQWDGGASTFNWGDAKNWVGDVLPMSADEAIIGPAFSAITVSSSGTVTIDKFTSSATVNITGGTFSIASPSTTTNLMISGGTLQGSGDVTVSNLFTWSGGTMRGTGKTVLAATVTGTITTNTFHFLGRVLDNAGSLTYSGNNLYFDSAVNEPGVLNNLIGATFTASGDGDLLPNNSATGRTFNNAGSFVRTGAGDTYFSTIAFNNTGTVDVQAGALRLLGGGSISGSGMVASGTTMEISGTASLSSSYSGAGTVSVTGGATTVTAAVSLPTLAIAGGTFTANAATTATGLTFSSGTLQGSGDLTITNSLSWSSGTMRGTGKTVLAATVTGTITTNTFHFLGRVLDNAGSLTYSGNNLYFDSAVNEPGVLNNLIGATFTASGDGDLLPNNSATGRTFNNAGSFVRTGAGDTYFSTIAFNNTGTVDVQAGALRLLGGGSISGSGMVASGTTMEISGTASLSSSYSGAGTVSVTGGATTVTAAVSLPTLAIAGGTFTANAATTATGLTFSSGTLQGSGDLTITNSLSWSSGTMRGTGKTVLAATVTGTITTNTFHFLGRVLDNAGSLTYSGNNLYFDSAVNEPGVLNNLIGATFTASGDGDLLPNNSATGRTFNNAGSFVRTGAGDTYFSTIAFNNTGTVDVQAGALRLLGGGSISGSGMVASGTTMEISGTASLSSSYSGAGTVSVTGGATTVTAAVSLPTLAIAGGTFTANAATTATGLTFSSGTLQGSGDLTITNSLSWSSGTMRGTGKTVLAATVTGTITTNTFHFLGRVLDNAGSLTYSGNNLYFDSAVNEPGVLNNLIGATFTASGDGDLLPNNSATGRTFNNAGSFIRTGTGDTIFSSVAFNNTGAVDVQAGALRLLGGGSISGSGMVASGTTMEISGTVSLSSSYSGAGTVSVTGGATTVTAAVSLPTLAIAGGTFTANAATTATGLTFSSGTLQGSGDLTITNSLSWSSGTMRGTGKTVLAATVTGTITTNTFHFLGRVLDNAGSLTYSGNNLYFDSAVNEPGVLNNLIGATFTASGDGDLLPNNSATGRTFNNAGSFVRTGAGDTYFSTIAFNNTGTVDVQAGALRLLGGGSISGSGMVASGTTMEISGTVSLSSSYSGAGTVSVTGGATTVTAAVSLPTLAIAGGTFTANAATTATGLTFSSGTLQGSGDLTITNSLSWSNGTMRGTGKTVLAAGTTGTITGSAILSRTLESKGTINQPSGTLYFGAAAGEAGILDNYGTFTTATVSNQGLLLNVANPAHVFINRGNFIRTGNTGTTAINIPFTNSGSVEVQQGELDLNRDVTSVGGQVSGQPGTTLYIGGVLTFDAATKITGATVWLGPTNNVTIPAGYVATAETRIYTNPGTVTLPIDAVVGPNLTVDGKLNFAGNLTALQTISVNGTFDYSGVSAATTNKLTLTGTLQGSGDLTVTNALTLSGGTMRGTGKTLISVGATATITGSAILSRTLESKGTINQPSGTLYFGAAAGEAGILDNYGTFTTATVSNQGLLLNVANPAHVFINRGNFIRTGNTGTTAINIPFTNSGSVEVQQGSLSLSGGTSFPNNGVGYIKSKIGTTLSLGVSLTGSTTNAELFAPLGTVAISGGSVGTPRLIEVMSNDLGNVTAGYEKNFAYGKLQLSSAYVKLVDNSNNSFGNGNEALYVDSLVVPVGSTLDLNLMKVYARQIEIKGTVIGGSVNATPDGGSLPLNLTTSGSISTVGEQDEWTFFGRGGDAVTVFGQPGGIDVLLPSLTRAKVTVYDPANNVLASNESKTDNETVSLLGVALPTDGTYKIRVSAAASASTNKGYYRLTAYDARVDTGDLVVNQKSLGLIDTAYSVDRWSFTAAANTQVKLDVIGVASAALRFKLTGPGGTTYFTNQTTDTGLVTLTTAGSHLLEVYSDGSNSGAYSFNLLETTQIKLPLATPYIGQLIGSDQAILFKTTVLQGNPLNVTFDDATNSDRTEVYLKLGSPPTRQQFDHRYSAANSADHQVLVPFAANGDWYVLVYGERVPNPSSFTIRADSSAILLTGVTPSKAPIGPGATVTVRGAGYVPGTLVELVGASTISAGSISVDSFSQMTAVFDLTTAVPGTYDVRATLPGGISATLGAAFQVTASGKANLETRMILPSTLRRQTQATIYVEYANTGTAPMLAPVLTFGTADPDGSDRPKLTLDQSLLASGLWSSANPPGFGTSVQIYASGEIPGILLPGEKFQVPVYFAGLTAPFNFSDMSAEFQIAVNEAGSPDLIDWPAISGDLRPDWIPIDAWPAVYGNLQANVGPTWGHYVQMLSDNASYLGRLGVIVKDIRELFGFELQQAVGLSLVGALESSLDTAVPTPGLPLEFGRVFANSLPERYKLGLFGRGWSVPWQIKLMEYPDGSVIIDEAGGGQRRFQPDGRYVGRYFAGTGDNGELRKVSGGHSSYVINLAC